MAEQLALSDFRTAPSTDFRPIQYLGNKWRLLDEIDRLVSDVAADDGDVYDIFAGTGVVARRLARRHTVVAADIQEYARALSEALLAPCLAPDGLPDRIVELAQTATETFFDSAYGALCDYEDAALEKARFGHVDDLCAIIENGSLLRHQVEGSSAPPALSKALSRAGKDLPNDIGSLLSRYYGGLYFSYRQAAELDALANTIRALEPQNRSMALAALISTASEIASTVGNQFAQPLRPRDKHGSPKVAALRTAARVRTISACKVFAGWLMRYAHLEPVGTGHRTVRADYRNLLRSTSTPVAAVYADPPYTRDHYSRFYHVLETIALGDVPPISEVTVGAQRMLGRALYREGRHQSPFCIRSQVVPAFRALFVETARLRTPVVVSYSPYMNGTAARPQPRLVTIEQIVDVAKEFYSDVEVSAGGSIAHSKLNRNELNRDVAHDAEVFIVARP